MRRVLGDGKMVVFWVKSVDDFCVKTSSMACGLIDTVFLETVLGDIPMSQVGSSNYSSFPT